MRCSDASSHYDVMALVPTRDRSALQKFHNTAKRALIEAFATNAKTLLDLACGRGGDIHKWASLGIRQVLGLDVSPESVAEARARYNARLDANKCPHVYTFQHADLCSVWDPPCQFDVVTCMFALHYFFRSEDTAHTFLRTVARALKPGGHFIGIVPDGLCINERIKHGPYDNGMMQVVALWHGPPACFGSAYTCAIHGTVTEGSVVPEFLVYDDVLTKVAAMHGLRPVAISHALFSGRATGSEQQAFHRLVPPYDGPLAEATSIYAAFAFVKS